MSQRVRITDVAPRDGLQNEPGVAATADKVRLIQALALAGVDEIEITSFVSPKWIPQLADAEAVVEAVRVWAAGTDPLPAGEGGERSEPGEGPRSARSDTASRSEERRARALDPRDAQQTERARDLRRSSTPPEQVLWSRLRDRRFHGVKFRRQAPVGPFIVDFVAEEAKLVIELDGSSHANTSERDAARDAWLKQVGFRVLRIPNHALSQDAESAMRAIEGALKEGAAPLPGPLPKGEGVKAAPHPGPLPKGEGVKAAPHPGPLPEGEGAEAKPVFSVLVPNEKGFARAIAFHSEEFPLKIAAFTAASETFAQRNTNASIAGTIERFRAFLPRAFEAGMAVRLYVSCAIACPFEGSIAPARVRRVADELLALCPQEAIDAGRVEIDLGDTLGVATPSDIGALLSAFDDDALRPLLVLHLHDTFDRAVECALAGLEWGVRSFDGAAGGLGGCPYAGTKERPAPGNIATEALVRAVHDAGFATSVDMQRLLEAGRLARESIASARPR